MKKRTTDRASGILLHPLSLPGFEGVGTLGCEAFAFIDWLAAAGQKVWQVLPLGPTGYGDSPYSSFSAFAGNPYMISLSALVGEGDLDPDSLAPMQRLARDRVNYAALYRQKNALLARAAERFLKSSFASADQSRRRGDFESFAAREQEWLDDFALFMTAKARHNGLPWQEWPRGLALREDRAALEELRKDPGYGAVLYAQWQFSRQWKAVREYADKRGITIIGDAPIFVASDSADAWSGRKYFQLDGQGRATAVAGVPPDYFSPTGQLWGNPLYDWDALARDGYAWWKKRIARLLDLVHRVRIDHFRGFVQYWAVRADADTAVDGKWRDGPGEKFFMELVQHFGEPLPLIAEDLGIITPDVAALRDAFSLPGMRIFCFAPWGQETWNDETEKARKFCEHSYVPEQYVRECIAYPGTHDNDTFVGWLSALNYEQRVSVEKYLGCISEESMAKAVVECLLRSKAGLVIFLMQDILGLPASARYNTPGTCNDRNWTWRLLEIPDTRVAEWLQQAVKQYLR
ncbi:MAG: 4-alpha-glucanotransferase [Spirochaetota bacterium]|nr:4-alpha-glucanotransferase [Spirochaetota bacterium]